MNKHVAGITSSLLALACALMAFQVAQAYLPPVDERAGARVEIGSFPQKTERTGKNPFSWPLGVTEVQAGAPREFPVTVVNTTDAALTGTLDVWMNDDWTVAGPQGALALAPLEARTLTFVGTAKPRALDALYPVHARFTPAGVKPGDAPHPIAVFMYKNPAAPRSQAVFAPLKLTKGVYHLDSGFTCTTTVEVNGKTRVVEDAAARSEWGTGWTRRSINAGGVSKMGFSTHPPYRKGAGFLWCDYALELPTATPIAFSCANFLGSPGDQPASDGAEYRVYVLEEGAEPKLVASHIVVTPLTWQTLAADLTPWAGRKITLRLWTGPGPKMNTCCDGGGWGDLALAIGPQVAPPTEAEWQARAAQAGAAAQAALTAGTDAAAGRYRLDAGAGAVYGAGVVRGPRGLIDGALAFSDGQRTVAFRGFDVEVDTGDGSPAPRADAQVYAEKGTLRVKWSLPGTTQSVYGFPRITRLAVGPASETLFRVYAGFGNVIENPKSFTMGAGGFAFSTRHAGADYANGLSVVQAVDVPPDRLVCDGASNRFSIEAHHDALFTFAPSSKGAFAAARAFRAVSGYRASPGHARLGSRMCLDQWSGDYAAAATNLAKAAKYGMNDTVFVKHDWQCWGYDYRLPEIYPPRGDVAAFGAMREACRAGGILFVPHDNYTDIYPDAENYSYDLTVFNLDGTPQRAWFNPGRHALSYRWAPHAYLPWCRRNARLLKDGFDPDGVFIDVFTAHGPFDYLDRQAHFHSKMETSRRWGEGFAAYRAAFGADAVCVSEAGQDHLVGVADAGQSDHFGAAKLIGAKSFGDSERTPWHDIATHNYYVLFAGGLGGRYQEEAGWHTGGDAALHGYASDDYLSNAIIGGRNPMCDGPFNRRAAMTYWLQHDACADLGKAEFLDLQYEGNIHRQRATFSAGGEVWSNRQTNDTWRLANGVALPPYGYYAKTATTESGIVEKNGQRVAFAKGPEMDFYDARKPSLSRSCAAVSSVLRAEKVAPDHVRLIANWEQQHPVKGYRPFVHLCASTGDIAFQAGMGVTEAMFATPGRHEVAIDVIVPPCAAAGAYAVRYGAYLPKKGNRLAIGGGRDDGGRRICGGRLVVKTEAGKVTDVAWQPEETGAALSARERLLGVNRAGTVVDFGGVKTDGSFRLAHPASGDWILTPLPDTDAFTVELDLAAFGAAHAKVAKVEPVEPEADAAAPAWSQTGAKLALKVDARAFAYRVRFLPES